MVNCKHVNIVYPSDGTQASADQGTYYIDFKEGKHHTPSGTITDLSINLDDTGQDFIRSIVIDTGSPAVVTIPANSNNKFYIHEGHDNIIERLQATDMTIQFLNAYTPGEISYRLNASSSSTAVKRTGSKYSTALIVRSQASTDAYATLLERSVEKFNFVTLNVLETGGANGITYKVEVGPSQVEYYELQGDTAVAASGSDRVTIQGSNRWVKISVKSTAAGNAGTCTGALHGG